MLEFLRQLSHEACDLFQHIACEVNKFANSKHQKKTFTRAKGSIAFNMGVIRTSIQSFAFGRDDWAGSVCHLQTFHSQVNLSQRFMPEGLYDLMPEVLGQLQWLGRGFNQIRFEQGEKSLHIEHTGIHFTFPLFQDDKNLAVGSR